MLHYAARKFQSVIKSYPGLKVCIRFARSCLLIAILLEFKLIRSRKTSNRALWDSKWVELLEKMRDFEVFFWYSKLCTVIYDDMFIQ